MSRDIRAEKELMLHLSSISFKIQKCGYCNFRALDPQPSENYLNSLYDKAYFEDEKRHYSYSLQAKESLPAFKKTAVLFLQHLGKSKRVLDIGCATGEFLTEIQNLELIGKGIEPSEYCAKACASKGLDVVHGSLFQQKLNELNVDGIHMSHVLEHLVDPNEVIKRIKSWLDPKGVIYIEVPLQFDGFLEKIQKFRHSEKQFSIFSVHHVSFFSPKSLRMLLESNGLEIISLTTYNPDKRLSRRWSIRKMLLTIFLRFANRFSRGDIIGVWAKPI